MPLRSPKIYSFIFGFQRLVWCPKWTPASSNSFIDMAGKNPPVNVRRRLRDQARFAQVRRSPGWLFGFKHCKPPKTDAIGLPGVRGDYRLENWNRLRAPF